MHSFTETATAPSPKRPRHEKLRQWWRVKKNKTRRRFSTLSPGYFDAPKPLPRQLHSSRTHSTLSDSDVFDSMAGDWLGMPPCAPLHTLTSSFASLLLDSQEALPLFSMPELVCKIIEYADAATEVPHERAPVTRSSRTIPHQQGCGVLYACMLVNRLWFGIAQEILGRRLFFTAEGAFLAFARSDVRQYKPTEFVLNKLFYLSQLHASVAERLNFSALRSLEYFMCPKLLPPLSVAQQLLRLLVVTGSKALTDSFLVHVAAQCPRLEALDIRACDAVTDYGVYAIARHCRHLQSVNLGRKKKGALVTDLSVCVLAANNPHLTTVGLAGCHVSDRSVWLLALLCHGLQRLLLNNCPLITNQLLPVVLHHNLLPRLCVLEIRNVALRALEPIVLFKRRQQAQGIDMLLETCPELAALLAACEGRLARTLPAAVATDLAEWVNAKDDDAHMG